jgi:hypothetical protein
MQQEWISRLGEFCFIFHCMSALRLLLIVGNALLFTWMACIFPTDHAIANTSDYVFGFGVLVCSGPNLIYLLLSLVPAAPSPARRITAER